MSEDLTVAAVEERIAAAVEPLREQLETERERRRQAEQDRDQLRARVAELEARLDEHDEQLTEHDAQLDDHDTTIERIDAFGDALSTRVDSTINRVAELQARELEKGAHLDWANVDGIEDRLTVDGGRVERFTDDDGQQWARLPGEADPLDRSESARLAMGDLLPIQQLARMDDEMLRSSTSSLPAQLAAKAWRDRENGRLWNDGSGKIRHYVDASELRAWIRREESGISESYAKKLVSRTLDALQELTKNRVYVERRTRRKDGLQYTERRLVLPSDSAIPGETSHGTDDTAQAV